MLLAFLVVWAPSSLFVMAQRPRTPPPRPDVYTVVGRMALRPSGALPEQLRRMGGRPEDAWWSAMVRAEAEQVWSAQDPVVLSPGVQHRARAALTRERRALADAAAISVRYDERTREVSFVITGTGEDALLTYARALMEAYAEARQDMARQALSRALWTVDSVRDAARSELDALRATRPAESAVPEVRRGLEADEFLLAQRVQELDSLRRQLRTGFGVNPARVWGPRVVAVQRPDIHYIPKARNLIWALIVAAVCAISSGLWRHGANRLEAHVR